MRSAYKRANSTLMMVGKQILGAAVVVAGGTLVARAIGAVKDLVIAQEFGVSASLDAFLLAYLIPSIVINVLAGSLQVAFVPRYLTVQREQGDAAARALAASTATFLFVGLTAAALIVSPLAVFSLSALTAHLPAEAARSAQTMGVLLSPIIVLNGLMYFWCGVLNSHNRFALAALIPSLTPIAIGVAALFFSDTFGIQALVVGAWVGGSAEVLVVAAAARAVARIQLLRIATIGPDHRLIVRQFLAAAAGSAILAMTLLVDQSAAASLGPGGVSALSFGTKLPQGIAGVLAMALATALLPNAARLVADRNWHGVRRTLRSMMIVTTCTTVPLVLIFVLFSTEIVKLVFERGEFESGDTTIVSRVQALYALHLPFFAIGILAVRMLSAMSANHIIMVGAGISLAVDAVSVLTLTPALGVAGIGLSTSVMYFATALFLVWQVRRRIAALQST